MATNPDATEPAEAKGSSFLPGSEGAGLKSLIRRGALWVLAGYAVSQLIRLGGNLVLWRLLHPEVFGLMAVVNVFMQGLHMFSDVGIGPSIIQNKRGDEPDYLNTAWTIQVIRGGVLFLVASAAAAPVAAFYGQPQLASLIPVVGLNSLISGFNSTRLMTATRHVALGRLTLIDLGAQLCGLLVMVSLALSYRSIWALVLGASVSTFLRLVLSHSLLPGIRNRLLWHKSSALVLLKFGRWIFLSTLLGFAVEQSDRLIFGKLIPMSMLGVYSIALMWASLPMQVTSHVFNSVLFPVLSRVHNQGQDLRPAFRDSGTPWLMLAGWISACLLSGGPLLVRFLYDERALDAGTFMQILGAGVWLGVLSTANATALFARGLPKWVVAGSVAKLIGMLVLIPFGMSTWGFPGAVAGFAASELLSYAMLVSAATRLRLKEYGPDIRMSIWVAMTTLAGWTSAMALRALLPAVDIDRVGVFLQGTLVFVVVSAGWGYVFWAHRLRARQRVLLSA